MAIRNPYSGADFAGVQVASLTHEHQATVTNFNKWYTEGFRHFGISEYYPSNPARTYPLTNIASLTPPADAIGCPNAEHHSLTNASGHFAAVGSTLSTGTVSTGYGGTWTDWVDAAVAAMLYPNSGAIIANHPQLSYPGDTRMMEMLDYSPHVAGIEIWNGLADWYYPGKTGWAVNTWHHILLTGRRCYGFGAPDHWAAFSGNPGNPATARGRNMLVLPTGFAALSSAAKEQACLEAYYNGEFYVALESTSPVLSDVTADASEVSVTFGSSCDIHFVVGRIGEDDPYESTPVTGTTATYTLQEGDIYVRAVGTLSEFEVSLTQPIMYLEVSEVPAGETWGATIKRRLFLQADFDCCPWLKFN